MFKHILIATDGSRLAETAANHGLELAKQLNAKVTAVTVTEPWTDVYGGPISPPSWAEVYENAAAKNAAAILASVSEIAKTKQVPCATYHVQGQQPAEGLIETANSTGCDLIVMASHGRRGVAKLLLGSIAPKVVALSKVPVLICR